MGVLFFVIIINMEKLPKPENSKFELSLEKAKSLFEAGSLIDALEELTISGEALWNKGGWTEAETQIWDDMQELTYKIEALLLK